MQLRRFQKEFLAKGLAPGIDVAALSLSRGNGKSFLAAHILTRCLTPGDVLHQPGKEYVQCAGSIEQARMCTASFGSHWNRSRRSTVSLVIIYLTQSISAHTI